MYDDTNITMNEEEEKEYYRENENDLLESLLDAADYVDHEVKNIQIIREGKIAFQFRVHPLSEEDMNSIRKKYTKYTKNKRNGAKVAEEIDSAKYRSSIIYNSTIEEDQEKIWNNKALWKGLSAKGKIIVTALDVVECLLLPGEKERVLGILDDLNGYNSDETQEETAKNS